MNGLFRILIITYIISINVYSYLLVYFQKKQIEENSESTIKDGRLYLASLIGGATGLYVAMFIYKYRLYNLLLMVFIPILIVLNVYAFIALFTGNLTFFT